MANYLKAHPRQIKEGEQTMLRQPSCHVWTHTDKDGRG